MTFVTKENTQDIYPLSPTQEGMLFHSIYDEETRVYFEQVGFTINGPMDIDAFKFAWMEIIRNTPVFRTVFKWSKIKKPVQIVLKELPLDFKVHDISHLAENERKMRLESFLKKDRATSFNIEEGPLIRFNLFILAENMYRFVWSYHHIILDGWCLSLVMKDLFDAYMERIAGVSVPRTPRRPYKDYIAWYLKQDKDAANTFWREQLGDFESPTPLPFDRKAVSTAPDNVGEVVLELDEDLTSRLQDVVKKERITQNTLVQSIWALLLAFYGNRDDVVFGVTSSGRPSDLKGSDEIMGLFINTLPLRVKPAPETTFSELLRMVQASSLAVRDFEYSFLPEVKNCSSVSGTQNLFETIVVFENYPVGDLLKAATGEFYICDIHAHAMTNFPLTLVVVPGERLDIRLLYATELYDHDEMTRLMNHFSNLINQAAAFQDKPVKEMDMLDPAERKAIVNGFNDTFTDFPREKCVHELFEEMAAKYPEKEALVFGNTSMTYREMNCRANRIAAYLRQKGVKPDMHVPIMVERSFDMLVGLVGILKAGGAYVPIDFGAPRARIDYMLEDLNAPVAIVHEAFKDRFDNYRGDLLCPESFWKENTDTGETNPDNVNTPDDTAYVIYTSGSTGQPKGVLVPHLGTNRLVVNTNWADIATEDRFLQTANFVFDAVTMDFWAPLLNGGTLVLTSKEDSLSPEVLADLIHTHDITIVFLTTVMFNQLMDTRPESIAGLKALVTGGENHSLHHMRIAVMHAKRGAVIHAYGPTENSTYSTYYPVASISSDTTSIPIGYPVANSTVYILDTFLKPVPVGVPGEIYVGGDGLARGYLNDPEKTAAAFIPNPLKDAEDAIIYKTGDLGKWLAQGSVVFLGRIDHQVKIRGYRIELGEIENALREMDTVTDAVVVVRTLENGNKMLNAYYVSEAEIPIDVLRTCLGKTLPDYMIPSHFIRLDVLPLNQNGKVDKSALPEPQSLRPEITTAYAAPENDIQAALAETWKGVLALDKVGIYDNFFDLGGDSIISLQVVGRLKKINYMIRPRDIFENQTIAELALVVRQSDSALAEQGPVEGIAPLTPVQKWFFELEFQNRNQFNQSFVFKSMIPIDREALKQALQAVLDHHDALRMRFSENEQENMPLGESIHFIVKEVGTRDALEAEVNDLQTLFDISEGPLFSAAVFQYQDHDYVVFAAHHLVVDGVSWRILLEDIFSAYGFALNKGDIVLSEKTTSFIEWSRKLTDYADALDPEAETAFWKQSAGGNGFSFPVDADTGNNDYASSAVLSRKLGRTDTDHLLRDAHLAFNTEVKELLLTALMRTLQAFSGRSQVVIDLEGHGREEVIDNVDVSRTVGWFTAIFPMMLDADEDLDLSGQIKYVKEALRAVPDKGFNYGVLKYLKKTDALPDIGHQLLFNYLGQMNKGDLDGLFTFEDTLNIQVADPAGIRSHLIDINCMVENQVLSVYVTYSRNRHKEDTMQAFIEKLAMEMEQVIRHCMARTGVEYTPSDFELTSISQDQLDDLIDDIGDIDLD